MINIFPQRPPSRTPADPSLIIYATIPARLPAPNFPPPSNHSRHIPILYNHSNPTETLQLPHRPPPLEPTTPKEEIAIHNNGQQRQPRTVLISTRLDRLRGLSSSLLMNFPNQFLLRYPLRFPTPLHLPPHPNSHPIPPTPTNPSR